MPPAAAGLLAGTAAGPWPGLPAATMLWRVPLAAAALVLLWPRLPRWRYAVAAIVLAALAVDGLLPARVPSAVWAARVAGEVRAVQRRLEALGRRPTLLAALEAGGAEAAPEVPFTELRLGAAGEGLAVDALVLVDERGTPIAWTGARSQMPLRLRLLGERAVAAEPGVADAWVWWREPILEGGRTVGQLLAGAVIPEEGARAFLGVAAGRAAAAIPRWEGGTPLSAPSGGRLLGIDVVTAPPAAWSTPAAATALVACVLAASGAGLSRPVMAAVAVAVAAFGAGAEAPWLGVAALLAFAAACRLAVGLAPPPTWVRAAAWAKASAMTVGVAALTWQGVGLLTRGRHAAVPEELLHPSPWQLALVLAATLVFAAATPPLGAVRSPLRVVAWLPLVAGTMLGDARLVAFGAGTVVLAGLPSGAVVLPGVAAALAIAGSDDAARRSALTVQVDATLARLASEGPPARALLESFPESGMAELVRLAPGEIVVVLGRVAGWAGFAQALPGGSLVLLGPEGDAVAVWGQTLGGWGAAPRELDSRPLPGGWRLAVVTAERPYNVLAALAAAGIDAPTAAIDRAGGAVTRGATFRPMAPDRVGRALAGARSWGTVGVGEREYRAYLRTYADWVVAVPWIRAPLSERGLSLAGLALWGALPVALWRYRRWPRDAWAQRRTFAGRLRVFSAAATLVPLLLLAQILPRQWADQQGLARLELGRALSRPFAATGVDQQVPWLVRDMGATVALYRDGRLLRCSRPDLVAVGEVPWLAPEEAFVRSVRGWREPLVTGDDRISVFAPLTTGQAPEVGAVLDLQVAAGRRSSSPREWFVITGVWAAVLALGAAGWAGRRLAGPLQALVEATNRLKRGESVAGLPTQTDAELATLTSAFEEMAGTVQRREEELRHERDLLERVLGTLSAAVVVIDAEGKGELTNASARRVLDTGCPLAALRERFGPAVAALLDRAAAGETAVETLHPPAAPEGLWQMTVMPLSGMRGRRLVVMEDLSEVARAERLASLAELARIVAHEVKNPLTPIRLWAEELLATLDGGGDRVAEIARTAAEQILERVTHLRDVAQGFSNLVALEHWEVTRVALEPLLRRVTDEYAVAVQRGIAIRSTAAHGCVVDADAAWVERAIRHLLENSLRAIGSRQGEVVLTAADAGGEVVVRVRDSGGGVPEANLGRLFEPHFSTTSHGTGLGLAVVRRVMERAGGRAEARNVGGGLEVTLAFPAPATTV